jgi:hypothetical protein
LDTFIRSYARDSGALSYHSATGDHRFDRLRDARTDAGAEHLGLTREQIATIDRNLDQHAQYANRIFQRIRVINRELDEEFSRERLDPMAFGVRYLEIETMKREYRERTRAIVAEHRSLLSASQRERLRNLREASRLDEANRQAVLPGTAPSLGREPVW